MLGILDYWSSLGVSKTHSTPSHDDVLIAMTISGKDGIIKMIIIHYHSSGGKDYYSKERYMQN